MVKKSRRYTPTVIVEGRSAAVPPPPAPLVIKLQAQKQTTNKAIPGLGRTSFIHFFDMYVQLICLSYDSGTETAGEQGDYYDPQFTYKEGDEASYFVISEDFGGDAADVGPSGAGTSKESPMASSSI